MPNPLLIAFVIGAALVGYAVWDLLVPQGLGWKNDLLMAVVGAGLLLWGGFVVVGSIADRRRRHRS